MKKYIFLLLLLLLGNHIISAQEFQGKAFFFLNQKWILEAGGHG